jgi:hypothetical protein
VELLRRKVAASVYKAGKTAVGIRHADHVAISIRKKSTLTSPVTGGCSIGIIRSRTQATGSFLHYKPIYSHNNMLVNSSVDYDKLQQIYMVILE